MGNQRTITLRMVRYLRPSFPAFFHYFCSPYIVLNIHIMNPAIGSFKIIDWSDGNDQYQRLPNVWMKFESADLPPGKVKLVNETDRTVVISSISEWKTLSTHFETPEFRVPGTFRIIDWTDGIDQYQHLPNVWLKYESTTLPAGKVKLVHETDWTIRIPSMSDWKTVQRSTK